ncbi:MAG: hypothetical protein DMD28_02060 [Gemmatimonadetes bacterium]|nr:MAG: hypothetical protein DMD28_02060 [Gemmatimonadota bacterium]
MLAYLVVAATLLAPRPASPPAPDSAETIRSVLAFEDGRFAAMVRADTTWLRDALAEDLSYVHTSARSETKAQYLESVGSHRLHYEAFTPGERRVRLLSAAAAVVAGLAHARVESGGQLVEIDVRYLAVYERVGARWRFVAWQTTRVP